MVSGLVTLCMAAALGQAPGSGAESAWLKSVPDDIEVVARVRGLEPVRDDLVKMVEAMSNTMAAQAKPALEQGLTQFTDRFGKAAAKSPFLLLMHLPKPGEMGTPPFAVLVQSDDYAQVQKHVAGLGGNSTPKRKPGGYDEIADAEGKPVYTYKGSGFVAFTNSEDLIGSIVKPRSTLDTALSADVRKRLFMGDAGLYVNLATVQGLYGDQIDQARQTLMQSLDNLPGMNDQTLKGVKSLYGGLFDSLKETRALALSFDFSREGLGIAGDVAVKPGSTTAKLLADSKAGPGESVAKLPAEMAYFFYLDASSALTAKLRDWGMSLSLGQSGANSAASKKAMDLQEQAGMRDTTTAVDIGRGGIRSLSVTTYADPQKGVDSVTATMEAMKSSKETMSTAMVKDVTIDRNAERYRGFTLNHSKLTWDVEKMAQQAPNLPKGANPMRAILGDALDTWYGTDDKVVVSIAAPDWSKAKSLLDDYYSGKATLGASPGYRAVRSKLPDRVTAIFLMSGQGLVRQLTAQFSAMAPNNPALKAPADLPKEPALIGTAIVTSSEGIQFETFVPGAVGSVFEKGLVPLFQGIAGQVNQ